GLIVFLVAAGESLALVGIVVPGVVFMLGIGALVGLDAINLWQALFWAAVGAIVGDWLSYWLGRHFDKQLRHVWPLSRYPELIPRGEAFFERHGGASVFFGRFVGPLRPIIPAIAGIMHMPQGKFYVINVVSAILWAPVVILPGVAFGESIQLANEVFFRLIAAIVIFIIVAVVLGYIAKLLVSYALVATIETLGDYFGFRAAKENIVSLSLMGVLVSMMTFFVAQYEISFQPLASKQQAVDPLWWNEHWSEFNKVPFRHTSDHPITFQWWGKLQNIDADLREEKWVTAPEFNIKSGLNYFLPEPEFGRLPVWTNKLFYEKEALLMLAPGMDNSNFYVLRLWPANPLVSRGKSQLWLGTVHSVDVYSLFNLIHIPISRTDYSRSLALLHSYIHNIKPPLSIQQKYYPDKGVTDSWKGEVLLLKGNGADNEALEHRDMPAQSLRQIGNTGLYMKSAKPFVQRELTSVSSDSDQRLQPMSYRFEDNGVVFNLDYTISADAKFTLDTLRQQFRERLNNVESLELVKISEKPLLLDTVNGVHYTAQYNMPPFGKQLDYHIVAAVDGAKVWVVTTSTKDCDQQGQRQLRNMLDSITIPSSN
ncbi:MAG: DedA family protein, partial [Gammaproteobacteria bacterium]